YRHPLRDPLRDHGRGRGARRADRLRAGRCAGGLSLAVQLVYLLAWPAGHSVSPAMHSAAFAQLGLAAEYRAWGVPPEKLRAAVTALRAEHVLGANVTIPHKQAVVPLVDELSA